MRSRLFASLLLALGLLLWPAQARAEPPPPRGNLVYQDDFSGTGSGLEDNLHAADYSRGFHAPGVYHIILNKTDDVRWELFPQPARENFTLELDLWDNSDEFAGSAAQGIVFRAQDATHLYALLLDPRGGQYAVRKLSGSNEWADLVAWTASPLVKAKSDVNHLRLDAEADQFTVYLNGEALGSWSDATYAQGSLGLIATNADAKSPHMHFDNVKLYADEASAPGLPQTSGETNSRLWLLGLALLGVGALTHLRRRAI